MAPLLLHLVFHPASSHARAIALGIHRALNADALLPNLSIPTRLLPEDGSGFPPQRYPLDEAVRSVVIVLADDEMAAEPLAGIPAGQRSWGQFVVDLKNDCDGQHRFLPVQLTPGAWPLHDDLRNTNFIRGIAGTEDEALRLIERRLVVEISLFLMNCDQGETLPVQLFLSHAKQDIAPEGPFNTLISHLNATQPVKSWVDSASISPGESFAKDIENGIRKSAVLALVTRSYSSRPYCRLEMLWAKEHRRPLVIVFALDGVDTRMFPYQGNAPTISWSAQGAEKVIDLLLKEQLRHLHAQLLLNKQKQDGDITLPVPPELCTLLALPKDQSVLYPDPPLGDEETKRLAQLVARIETPLQRAGKARNLQHRKIALSISSPDSLAREGMFLDHLDSAMLEISRHLLARGADLMYAGHPKPTGYAVKLFDLVLSHQQNSLLTPEDRILHYVGWPQVVTTAQRSQYRWQAAFKRVPRPEGVEDLEPATFTAEPAHFDQDSPARRFAWARGMSLMRETQTADMDARVVLGGKVGPDPVSARWYAGRLPGVLEEILLALQAGKPLYLCGAFGGATAVATELLQGRVPTTFTWDFHKQAPHSEGMKQLYLDRGLPWLDYPEMAKLIANIGVAGLAKANHLSEAENLELFVTRDVTRVVELLLTGLSRS